MEDNSLDYEEGAYLKQQDNFLVAPLNPAIGNAHVRSSNIVILRFFMGTSAVELGCVFRENSVVESNRPVLCFNYPVIGRVNRNYRAYRVKVVSGVNARLTIVWPIFENAQEREFQINDISAMGLSFLVLSNERQLEEGNKLTLCIEVPGTKTLEINGIIRHLSKARASKGTMVLCGIQFDLESRSLATDVEKMAAAIQRLQLREIAEKTAGMRGVRLIK